MPLSFNGSENIRVSSLTRMAHALYPSYRPAEILLFDDWQLQKTDKHGIVPMNDHSLQIHH